MKEEGGRMGGRMGGGRVISLGKWTKRPYQDCKRANNNSHGKITEVKETLLCQEKRWGVREMGTLHLDTLGASLCRHDDGIGGNVHL